MKKTAKELFFRQGNFKATTQEIADFAAVNRTLVHYYFKSRDILFAEVFQDAQECLKQKLNHCLSVSLPFEEKIDLYLDTFHEFVSEYPFLEIYIINSINKPNSVFAVSLPCPKVIGAFLDEVKLAMSNGLIKEMNPTDFLINLNALIVYPNILRPLFSELFIEEKSYEYSFKKRKELVKILLFNKPQ